MDEPPDVLPGEPEARSPVVTVCELERFPPVPSIRSHPFAAIAWLIRACVAIVCAVVLLAIGATIPIINVYVLGYLMEIQGQVARTGKFRSAFLMLPLALRLGIIALAVALWLLPIELLAALQRDIHVLAPGSANDWLIAITLGIAGVVIAAHLALAIAGGGRWWQFLRPIHNIRQQLDRHSRVRFWQQANHQINEFVSALSFVRLLRLGVLAYAAAYLWLGIAAVLFTLLDDVTIRWQWFGFAAGCLMLTVVLMWLPFLMAHVAAERRIGAMFEMGTVYKLSVRTPLCWSTSTAFLMASSVLTMLYTALVKNVMPPHVFRWDLMAVFLVTIIPARLLVGRAYHRATTRPSTSTHWGLRIWQWSNIAALSVGMGYYVYFLYLAQTGGELGQNAVWQFPSVLQPFPR
ncbi:hypothetical protein SH528x_006232 [Novipirellula sp. SH528]|uniref:hypothetical protein n=1 Tax=Novipirellula sp. SH528 TaxID=3454466 RepID=UPI003F9FF412